MTCWLPLGSVVTPAGLRPAGASASCASMARPAPRSWTCGRAGLAVMELPPGTAAVAELRFNDTVRLGGRGRRFAVDVTGGLGGLLVDLRDVPLRLPDRPDLRAELLETWQTSVWASREP